MYYNEFAIRRASGQDLGTLTATSCGRPCAPSMSRAHPSHYSRPHIQSSRGGRACKVMQMRTPGFVARTGSSHTTSHGVQIFISFTDVLLYPGAHLQSSTILRAGFGSCTDRIPATVSIFSGHSWQCV